LLKQLDISKAAGTRSTMSTRDPAVVGLKVMSLKY